MLLCRRDPSAGVPLGTARIDAWKPAMLGVETGGARLRMVGRSVGRPQRWVEFAHCLDTKITVSILIWELEYWRSDTFDIHLAKCKNYP